MVLSLVGYDWLHFSVQIHFSIFTLILSKSTTIMGLELIAINSENEHKEHEEAPAIQMGYSRFNIWRFSLPLLEDEDSDMASAYDALCNHPDNDGIWSYHECILLKKYLEKIKSIFSKEDDYVFEEETEHTEEKGPWCCIGSHGEYCLMEDYYIDQFIKLFNFIIEKGEKYYILFC